MRFILGDPACWAHAGWAVRSTEGYHPQRRLEGVLWRGILRSRPSLEVRRSWMPGPHTVCHPSGPAWPGYHSTAQSRSPASKSILTPRTKGPSSHVFAAQTATPSHTTSHIPPPPLPLAVLPLHLERCRYRRGDTGNTNFAGFLLPLHVPRHSPRGRTTRDAVVATLTGAKFVGQTAAWTKKAERA